MDKIKLLTRVCVGLLLLNVLTLGFVFFSHLILRGRPGGAPPDKFIINTLKMDSKQIDLYNIQKRQHHQTVDSLMHEMQTTREQIYAKLNLRDTERINKVGELQRQIESVTFSHFAEVRSALRPEQQMKLDNIVQEAVRKLNNNGNMNKPPRPEK